MKHRRNVVADLRVDGLVVCVLMVVAVLAMPASAADNDRNAASGIVCMVGHEGGWLVAEGRDRQDRTKLVWRVRVARMSEDSPISLAYDAGSAVITVGRERFAVALATGQVEQPRGAQPGRPGPGRPPATSPRLQRAVATYIQSKDKFFEAFSNLVNVEKRIGAWEGRRPPAELVRAQQQVQAAQKQLAEAQKALADMVGLISLPDERDRPRQHGRDRRARLEAAQKRVDDRTEQYATALRELARAQRRYLAGEATREDVGEARRKALTAQAELTEAQKELDELNNERPGPEQPDLPLLPGLVPGPVIGPPGRRPMIGPPGGSSGGPLPGATPRTDEPAPGPRIRIQLGG